MMENKKFLVSATPHLKRSMSAQAQSLVLICSLLLCGVFAISFYGLPALWIVLAGVASSYLFDMFFSYIFLGHFNFKDLTGVISGLVLSLIMPVGIPVYFVVIASLIAILFAKVMFGGQGKELVNGAALGACVLYCIVAGFGTTLFAASTVNGAVASPLEVFASNGYSGISIVDLLMGQAGGAIGASCALCALVGGIIVCASGVFDYYIPIGAIVAFVITILFSKGANAILPELLSGSFLFVTFFMLPSHASHPALWPSKLVYCIGFGVLAAVMRQTYLFGEVGVFFCLLLVNILSPFLDMLVGMLYRGRRVKKYE